MPIHGNRHESKSSIGVGVGGLVRLRKNLTLSNLSELSREGGESSLDANLDAPPAWKKKIRKKGKLLKQALVFPNISPQHGINNQLLKHTIKGRFGDPKLKEHPSLLIQKDTGQNNYKFFALLKQLGVGAEGIVYLLVQFPGVATTSSGGETSELCKELAKMKLACPTLPCMGSACYEKIANQKISQYCSNLAKGYACYALKKMRVGSTPDETSSIKNEVEIQKACGGVNVVNVVSLVEAWQLGNNFYIMMEYATEGTLSNFVKARRGSLKEAEARALFKGILDGVNAMHKLGFAHRDIKMDNVMVTQVASADRVPKIGFVPKIGDFGSAELVAKEKCYKDPVGTPHYMAPEIVLFSCQDPIKADVWALGVILYDMLVGSLPFTGDVNQVMYQIGKPEKNGHFRAEKFQDLTSLAQEFIGKMLNREPEDRITCANALVDDWMTSS